MIEAVYRVRCDKCGDTTEKTASSEANASEMAASMGWGGGHSGYDYCPKCKTLISKIALRLRADQWMLPDGTVVSRET